MSDEFYIGYEPDMPPRLARRVRSVGASLIGLSLVVPALLLFAQARFDEGVFEYGQPRSFEGMVLEHPYPMLDVGGVVHLLVGPYKFGASQLVAGLDGRVVRVAGTLIHRDGSRMIEIVPGTIEARESRAASTHEARLLSVGRATITGEIVDPKCYLGVMKPGARQVHRDCAVRCISGGIPPMLVAYEAAGSSTLDLSAEPLANQQHEFGAPDAPDRVLLLSRGGARPGGSTQLLVGKPISLSGTLLRVGDVWFLEADQLD
jgi:hypothetical protein